jgi:glycosyltransferase involved in cell wall biosynthesis
VRERNGLTSTDFVVLFVGGLDTPHYFKGLDVLLQAVARIQDSRVRLLIVGDGDLRPRYEALASQLEVDQRVTFCGYVPDEDLPCHYAAADLAVLPSTTRGEAFGIVLLEAMACAKPVIASNLPGVRTVVDHGSNGLLVKAGDAAELGQAITQLSNAHEKCVAMGQRGRLKVVQRYDWSSLSDQLESIYVEVLGR